MTQIQLPKTLPIIIFCLLVLYAEILLTIPSPESATIIKRPDTIFLGDWYKVSNDSFIMIKRFILVDSIGRRSFVDTIIFKEGI